jgi:hypothetical protein
MVRESSHDASSAPMTVVSLIGEGESAPLWFQTADGKTEVVEKGVALLSPFIQKEVIRYGNGAPLLPAPT